MESLSPTEQVGNTFISGGSTVTTVTQARDQFVEAQLPQAFGQAAQSSAEADGLQSLTALDPNNTGGLATAVSGFYSSLTAAAQNPSDSGTRTALLGAAQTLAQTFNETSQQIASSRSALDVQVSGLTTEVNTAAASVAALNGQIAQASATGGSPDELIDQRQSALDTLAQLTGGTPVTTSNGWVNVMLAGGQALVAGSRPPPSPRSPTPPTAATWR